MSKPRKTRHIKSLPQKYGFGSCDNSDYFALNEYAETVFNLCGYLGYLYIPKDMYDISGYLNEADDRDISQNHTEDLYKTKVVKVTDDETHILFVNYHMLSLTMTTLQNSLYVVSGNVLNRIGVKNED